MTKTAILIPTRLKSTRLPNKPLASINGKPLIQHVWEHAVHVHGKEDVYIASGDQEIIDVAQTFGHADGQHRQPLFHRRNGEGGCQDLFLSTGIPAFQIDHQ